MNLIAWMMTRDLIKRYLRQSLELLQFVVWIHAQFSGYRRHLFSDHVKKKMFFLVIGEGPDH